MNKSLWIGKSHRWTAAEDVNMRAIYAVMNTTWVMKLRPDEKQTNKQTKTKKKDQSCAGFEP